MTTRYTSRIVTPPEEEDIYPYRRVWRSIIIETNALLGVTLLVFILFSVVGAALPPVAQPVVLALLALLPLGLWALFSLLQERFVPEPRRRLLVVVVVTMLAANAVGIPLVEEFLQVDRWLPAASAVDRIIGYTFTFGIVHTLIKYMVVYYAAWSDHFRVRIDGVAYTAASAIGYATVLNLHYVAANSTAPLDVAAIRMFDNLVLQAATGFIIGYGLAQVAFSQPTPLLLVLALLLSATITGVVIPLRSGLVNASLFLGVSEINPLLGLALSLAVVVVVGLVVGYLIENADREEREAAASREV